MVEVGDIVIYQDEVWEIGFINIRHKKGTVRLQKSGSCYSTQINYVPVEELEIIRIEANKVYAQSVKEAVTV